MSKIVQNPRFKVSWLKWSPELITQPFPLRFGSHSKWDPYFRDLVLLNATSTEKNNEKEKELIKSKEAKIIIFKKHFQNL